MSVGRIARFFVVACAIAGCVLSAAGAGATQERIFALTIKGNTVPPHQRTIRVAKGDVASIEATADSAVVLHVHGLKLELNVQPGAPALLRIPTRATGRFRIELHATGAAATSHHHGSPLAYLEVVPK